MGKAIKKDYATQVVAAEERRRARIRDLSNITLVASIITMYFATITVILVRL